MKRKSPKQQEKENLLNKKKNADENWDKLMQDLSSGVTIDNWLLAQRMGECNWADYGLMIRGFLERKEISHD